MQPPQETAVGNTRRVARRRHQQIQQCSVQDGNCDVLPLTKCVVRETLVWAPKQRCGAAMAQIRHWLWGGPKMNWGLACLVSRKTHRVADAKQVWSVLTSTTHSWSLFHCSGRLRHEGSSPWAKSFSWIWWKGAISGASQHNCKARVLNAYSQQLHLLRHLFSNSGGGQCIEPNWALVSISDLSQLCSRVLGTGRWGTAEILQAYARIPPAVFRKRRSAVAVWSPFASRSVAPTIISP